MEPLNTDRTVVSYHDPNVLSWTEERLEKETERYEGDDDRDPGLLCGYVGESTSDPLVWVYRLKHGHYQLLGKTIDANVDRREVDALLKVRTMDDFNVFVFRLSMGLVKQLVP